MEWQGGAPIIDTLAAAGIELDQRMADALRIASPAGSIEDSHVLSGLCRLNPRGFPNIPHAVIDPVKRTDEHNIPDGPTVALSELTGSAFLWRVISSVREEVSQTRTLGASNFLRAIFRDAEIHGESFEERGFAIDNFVEAFGARYDAPLSEVPGAIRLLNSLKQSVDGSDDYQYALFIQGNRLVFRVISTLDEYVQRGDSGLWVPQKALLTHIERIGLFTAEQIFHLEELINNPSSREDDFQHFFERYPHFLRQFDFRQVYPHVYLTREDDGPLIPDFILTNRDAQKAAIVDLKRPTLSHSIIRRQKNRKRFADAIMEARAQLFEYRDWFDDSSNRHRIKEKVDMAIYRPRLMVIIGRASDFRDEIERQKLADRTSDIEIVTYDDILRDAKERMVYIDSAPDVSDTVV